MRPAFTLVELLVAIVVLTVGLLALAATAGLLAAHVADGGRLTVAAHIARSVIDSLASHDCASVTSASTLRDGTSAAWTATADSVATRVELTVAAELRRVTRRDAYRVLIPCERQ